MKSNMDIWNAVKQPPKDALKQIKGGRISGMTDINPQWRYQALTEQFGVCGFGWRYEPVKVWTAPGPDGEEMVFVDILLYVKIDGEWSAAIPGTGGSMLIAKEKAGLRASDEGVKMATTDALSVACKMLGIGADIYAGRFDGSKYKDEVEPKQSPSPKKEEPPKKSTLDTLQERLDEMKTIAALHNWRDEKWPNVEGMLSKAELKVAQNMLAAREKELKNG